MQLLSSNKDDISTLTEYLGKREIGFGRGDHQYSPMLIIVVYTV